MALSIIAQYARELAEPIRGFTHTLANPSKYLDKIRAYGSRDPNTGEYFCDSTNLGLEERMYGEEVRNFNAALDAYVRDHPGASEKEVADFILGGTAKSDINSMAKCLAETHGVDPDTVAQFSPQLQELYSHNLEALYMVAPDLADHADVPFTGEPVLDAMIAGSIIVGTTVGITRMRGKFSALFHNYKL